MKTVVHDGERYLLVKRSGESTLVYDPETGEEQYLPNAELAVTGESALETAARGVDEPVRRLLTAVHDEPTLGLLLELDQRGPLSVRTILGRYDLCESDLHGRVGELRVAGLLAEADAGGERGYRTTDLASEALDSLRRSP